MNTRANPFTAVAQRNPEHGKLLAQAVLVVHTGPSASDELFAVLRFVRRNSETETELTGYLLGSLFADCVDYDYELTDVEGLKDAAEEYLSRSSG